MTGPDYILHLSSVRSNDKRSADPASSQADDKAPATSARRPWLAIHWRCCETYSRIYRNRDATAYDGRCPRCGKALRVPVGPGGTSSRFFEAF